MKNSIKLYLDNTRKSYRISSDAYLERVLKKDWKNLIGKNLEVVFIWSNEAKIEFVEFGDEEFIVWDNHFWSYFKLYYNYLNSLQECFDLNLCEEVKLVQADCVWADLLRVSIQRIKTIDIDCAMLHSKYYLQYGRLNFIKKPDFVSDEDKSFLLTAKLFILLHELAHSRSFLDEARVNSYHAGLINELLSINEESIKRRLIEIKLSDKEIAESLEKIRLKSFSGIEETIADNYGLSILAMYMKTHPENDLFSPNLVKKTYRFIASYRQRVNFIYYSILLFTESNQNIVNKYKKSLATLEITVNLNKGIDNITIRDFMSGDDNYLGEVEGLIAKETSSFLATRLEYHLMSLMVRYQLFKQSNERFDFKSISDYIDFNLSYVGEESEWYEEQHFQEIMKEVKRNYTNGIKK